MLPLQEEEPVVKQEKVEKKEGEDRGGSLAECSGPIDVEMEGLEEVPREEVEALTALLDEVVSAPE